MVIYNNYTGNGSTQEATLHEKMDKNTMVELREQAKGMGITLSHYPKKHLLIDEIISVHTNQQKESEKAQVNANAIESMDLARQQTGKYGEANICGIRSKVIVTGKDHAHNRKQWLAELENRHPEIFEDNPRKPGEKRISRGFGASYAIISSLEDGGGDTSLFASMLGMSIDIAEDVKMHSDLQSSGIAASGLYSRENVEDFVEALNNRKDKPDGVQFGFIMTEAVSECSTWTLYDIVTCPGDENAQVQGCFKIESAPRRSGKGKDTKMSFPDPKRTNSIAMGLLTQSQMNFQRNESSWFADAFAFKHNVLARLGLMSFATSRTAIHPMLNFMISGKTPLSIDMIRSLLVAAHGGQLEGNQLQEAKEVNWNFDHPYGIKLHISAFKKSSRTVENANKPNKYGKTQSQIWLTKDNISDLTVRSLILPFLEVMGFNRSVTTCDIIGQNNRTGSDDLALTNFSFLLNRAKELVEADPLHELTGLVRAIDALSETHLFLPYGANDGYQLVSRDASRARPQVVKTATSGNIGKNASHLQVRVEDFAGEPTICLLAVPYSEETIAMRNKSRDERNKAHKARNPKKVSQKKIVLSNWFDHLNITTLLGGA